MPIFSEGIVLPAPSRADRKIQSVSKWHCTTHAVRGAGPGTRMQGESKLEMDHQSLQYAQPDVADVVEQVLFKFGWRNEKRHVFDMIATKTSGERVACTVRPTSGLESKDFLGKLEVVAWWVQEKKFASTVRLLTEADIDSISLHNANLNAAVHDSDPDAETAVCSVACQLRGAISIKALTDEVGLKERGYCAILRLISKRELQPVHHERTAPKNSHPMERPKIMNAIVEPDTFAKSTSAKSGFRIEQADRLTIEGRPFDWAGQSGDTIFLQPADGQGLTEQFTMGMLSRLSAAGAIKHEVGYYLPDDLKTVPQAKGMLFQVSDLNPAQKKRFYSRYVQIMAIDDMVSEGLILPNMVNIEASKKEIETRAAAYLKQEATERDLLNHALEHQQLPESVAMSVRKGRGGGNKDGIALYSADYLRKLYKKYQKQGLSALADTLSKCGNPNSGFRPAEQSLLMSTIRTSYLTLERKTLKTTIVDVQRAFRKENQRLEEEGGGLPLRVPGRDAIRTAIKKLDPLRVMIARYGREYAIKQLRPVGKGLEVSRPGERVEMDEWCIDLQSIIHSADLKEFFGDELLDLIGLNGETARWWLVLAIDCRTKIILGMKLTRNPCTSAAQECLRMIVSDKGEWADAS